MILQAGPVSSHFTHTYTWVACVLMGIDECEGQGAMPGAHFIFESGSPAEPGGHRFG